MKKTLKLLSGICVILYKQLQGRTQMHSLSVHKHIQVCCIVLSGHLDMAKNILTLWPSREAMLLTFKLIYYSILFLKIILQASSYALNNSWGVTVSFKCQFPVELIIACDSSDMAAGANLHQFYWERFHRHHYCKCWDCPWFISPILNR